MTETLPKNGTRVHVEFDGKVYGSPRPGDWIGAASQTPAEFRELNPSLVRRRNV
jgi:hypothetical protein